MRIIEKTSTILKLQEENTLGKRFVMGGLGIGCLWVGIGVSFDASAISTLTCERIKQPQATCKLITSRLFTKSVKPLPSGHLQNAEMDTTRGEDGDEHQIILITNQDRIPFPGAHLSTYMQKRKTLNRINAFLQNPDQVSLKVQQDDRWFVISFGVSFTLFGSYFVYSFFAAKILNICVFDKHSGQLYLKKGNILNSEIIKYPLHEIIEATVSEEKSDGDVIYTTQLRFISDKPLPLEISGSRTKHYRIAQSINQFIKLGT